MKRWTLPDNTVNSSAIENAVDTDTLSCVALTGTRPTIDILFERRDNTGRPTSIRTVVLYIPTYESNAYKADGLQLKVSVHREFSMSHTFTAGANMGYVWDGTDNVALHKKATMSSTYIKSGDASLAVNGNTGTTFSGPGYTRDARQWNCIHTADGESNPYWEVDLGQNFQIDHITIFRRSDKCTAGTYGENCGSQCGEGCKDTCDKENGHCQCKDGWKPDTCDRRE
nr:hypothetical protein BaRGS_027822 [Batillaria attramentaria]